MSEMIINPENIPQDSLVERTRYLYRTVTAAREAGRLTMDMCGAIVSEWLCLGYDPTVGNEAEAFINNWRGLE